MSTSIRQVWEAISPHRSRSASASSTTSIVDPVAEVAVSVSVLLTLLLLAHGATDLTLAFLGRRCRADAGAGWGVAPASGPSPLSTAGVAMLACLAWLCDIASPRRSIAPVSIPCSPRSSRET